MKKVGDLFQELGFNANASDDVKIAFIKNLVRAAYGVDIPGPKSVLPKDNLAQAAVSIQKTAAPKKLEQLSFNFDVDLKKAN